MRYRLVVLTHGDCAPLEATLASFQEHVSPAPADGLLVYDGRELYGAASPHPRLTVPVESGAWTIVTTGTPSGFCAATRLAWALAADAGPGEVDHVFWLEHDFLFERDLDLRDLALILDADRDLCQMQLMRDAVSDEERDAGGLFELRRAGYDERIVLEGTPRLTGGVAPIGHEIGRYLRHQMYLTTNPALMRCDWMAEHPWPDYPSECEGRFGLDLVQDGWRFGVWGRGEPWVTHAGVRDGFGY